MLYDLHTHTFLSDGSLSPLELIRRASAAGYRAIALTDHVGHAGLSRLLPILLRECQLAQEEWGILAIPGVELTHLPPRAIPEAAREARRLGARLILVHGETIVEPVEAGTNRASLECPEVDILAHPGLLTLDEAKLAAAKGIFLEISGRKGHAFTNGHLVKMALLAGAPLLLNSDAHDPEDLLTPALARSIALGSGLDREELELVLEKNPAQLLARRKLL